MLTIDSHIKEYIEAMQQFAGSCIELLEEAKKESSKEGKSLVSKGITGFKHLLKSNTKLIKMNQTLLKKQNNA